MTPQHPDKSDACRRARELLAQLPLDRTHPKFGVMCEEYHETIREALTMMADLEYGEYEKALKALYPPINAAKEGE